MFVCVCEAVTENQIIEEIEGGSDTMEQLQDRLGVACNCARCFNQILSIIDKNKKDNTNEIK